MLDAAAMELVECCLMCDEAPLEVPIAGTTDFAQEFAARVPREPQERSLRQLDFETRLFHNPCSFLIDMESFDALPDELRERFWKRMDAALSGSDTSELFNHLCQRRLRDPRQPGGHEAGSPGGVVHTVKSTASRRPLTP